MKYSFQKCLDREFYNRPTLDVARELLGKLLVVKAAEGIRSGIIVETEGYLGVGDLASHSRNGKTERNKSMFGPPGSVYVYFTYGTHWMLNFATREAGIGEAVLIRAIEPSEGIEFMRSARKVCNNQPIKILTNGPAKLAQAFGIVRNGFDGADLCSEKSIISVHDIGICYELSEICVTTRIGIREDADKPWRFYVKENDYISKK